MLTKGGVGGQFPRNQNWSKGTPKRTNFRPVSCELSFEYCFIQISSYSRSYVRTRAIMGDSHIPRASLGVSVSVPLWLLVRMIYDKTKGQVALRPWLRKQNKQAKEVYSLSRVVQNLISRTFCYCLRFSAELTSKLEEEVQPPSTDKRTNSRKRIMSAIDGIPYQKVYVPNGKQLFTLHQTRTRRLIILTGHFVYTESVKIFALFKQNWWSRLNINFLF